MTDLSLRCLLSVAKTKNFTSTAKELAISQQAVSQNIQRLEEELNIVLLNRSGKKEYLTPAGVSFLEWVQKLDRELAIAGPLYSKENNRPTLSIGLTDFIQMPVPVVRILQRFLADYPDVNLQFHSGTVQALISEMKEQTIDVCLLPGLYEPDSQGISTEPLLFDAPLYVVMDKHLKGMCGQCLAPPQFDLLTVNMGEQRNEQIVMRAQSICVQLGIPIPNVRILSNVQTLYLELYDGNGYSILPMTEFLSAWTEEMDFHKTPLTIPLVLSKQLSNVKPFLETFMQYLKSEIVGQNGGGTE